MSRPMWTCRDVFYFRDEVGKPRAQVKAEKAAKQTALLRKFLQGPEDEREFAAVRWEEARRYEEKVKNERKQAHGVAVVYEAPMGEAP